MQKAYADLLSTIAPIIGGCGGACVATDPKTLYILAKHHSVSNLLSYAWQGRDDLDPTLRNALDVTLFSAVRQQIEQDREAERVFAALRAADVRFLPMKGVIMRKLYPAPEMRISCDVDVFFDRDRREKVGEILASLGYEMKHADPNHDEYSKPPLVSVEMHRNLLIDIPTVDRYYRDIWERLIPVGGSEYRMSDEDFYIYQTVHTMKHFCSGGTGIRSVMDTFVYKHAKPELDRAYLEAELEKLGLLSFHLMLEELSEVWFGGKEMTDGLHDISDYMLGSGTYGITANSAANRIPRGRFGKLRYALSRAFPSYRFMREKYPSLRRCPPLLPFYWAWRLVRTLFGGNQMGRELTAIRNNTAEESARVDAIMKKAGLYGYK